MPIDFFNSACIDKTRSDRFGICDDPPPSTDPPYLNYDNKPSWIAEVVNTERKEVRFIAVDHCVEILRPNGEQESRCDCILTTPDAIAFVELKDRAAMGWIADGLVQLTITIQKFKENHSISDYLRHEGYIANKQRPFFNNNMQTLAQKFKDDTDGFKLKVRRVIEF